MKKGIALALLVASAPLAFGCARINQEAKRIQSEFTGIPRTVELYSYDGKKLKEYSSAQTLLDFQESHVVILVGGKRVTASNVIVISEEL